MITKRFGVPLSLRFDRFDKLIYRLSVASDIPFLRGIFKYISSSPHSKFGKLFSFVTPLNKGD